MWDCVNDGLPSEDIPAGLLKCKKYGIQNVMLEIDLVYFKNDYEKFGMSKLCRYVKSRIDWIRAKT